MVPSSLWAIAALIPLIIPQATALIFELSPHVDKRQPQHRRFVQKVKRAAPVLPATWAYLGCYTDGVNRALTGSTIQSDTMTVDTCVAYCNNNGYLYAGVEYSRECYCDNAIQNGNTIAAATTDCNMMCAGDATQTCGGSYRLNVYKSSKPPPAPLASYNGWGYQGCYTDSAAARTLTTGMGVVAPLTPQKCLDACHAQGYLYAGVEYSVECYCGNAISNGGVLATDPTTCDMTCAGDATSICGGGNRLSFYQYGAAPISSGSSSSSSTSSTTSTTASTSTTSSSASASASQSVAATGPTTLASYNGWTSKGCYVDSVAARTLPVGMAVTGGPAAMTVQLCADACHASGYSFAGVEYAQECYCGNTIPPQVATDGRCNMVCNGNPNEYCGGSNGLNVYQYGTTGSSSSSSSSSTSTSVSSSSSSSSSVASPSTSGPTTLAAYNGWTSKGCYVDSVAARTLPVGMAVTGGPAAMTVQLCADACHASGYPFAGVEYAQECYCGNTIPPQVATDGRCSMVCNGNPNEYCGGSNGLNVYQYGTTGGGSSSSSSSSSTSTSTSVSSSSSTTSSSSSASASASGGPSILATYGNWISQGCWSDDPAQRSLSYTANTGGANTPQKCMDTCYAAGYDYAGVEYAAECYCGNAVVNAGTLEDNSGCNMVCQADPLHYCGGPYRLDLYKYNGTVPPPVNPPPGGGAAVGPVTTGLPAPWAYNACYVDNTVGRILGYAVGPTPTNSAATCIAACQAQGFTLAGMEYADECYCGNALQNGATKAAADTDCDMACSGDAQHACGGPNRVSLYASVQTFPSYPPPTTKTTGLPGQYQFTGCFAEPAGGQTIFQYQITDQVNMSVESCLNQCSTYGYGAAALEYGDECWCGDASQVPATSAAAATDCDIPCKGSPIEICGGASRFTLYSWDMTTNPLYVWNTPANTGHYELLIGGIVIPLIATLGLNNKVTFLEKYGTGAPNSTGAYELDYQLANDYTKAWRVMHVSSDVFCAANLVLPDRAGRILSIGGWSLESTQGVRLYTPSGSTGVNGTTDWEEYWDEIHLQQGRWYPGSMQMANGSIMVIGGEQGSNGAPVPSIEILPTPAGGPTYLTMDWLLQTDPNNLYPFSFVLPGGGILVIYFNQARILNEVDFSTTSTLPLIPGAVNAVGGRTYPMEGTAMVLPQYAPYTDPIEVLVCGGSAFGQAFDNCVSILPEVANSQWVIERMPSKRVMTIMTALPDGTYIIMGGAEQGVAGFGLAIDPNLQAILYDPSKPRNQRFSILGETSVARLYHSECILLHDGRVLVTGSDPEDNVNPQEYRMEVYVPPYLTSGLTQPTYTITNRDWTYGGSYQINVNLFQGTTSTMRVSLMGAVSTTHGNSFGQRTFFPAFTCAGNTCTITAPPNAHVSPPGWHQLFILDGPTPSFSQWVRIGGDPGSIGNWPNYPGFTLPGVGGI